MFEYSLAAIAAMPLVRNVAARVCDRKRAPCASQVKTLPKSASSPLKKRVFSFPQLALSEAQAKVADRILEEIRTRLQFLDEVGLDYLRSTD